MRVEMLLLEILAVVLVCTTASPIPVPVEDVAPADISQLLQEANYEENDIFEPKTESPFVDSETSSSALEVESPPEQMLKEDVLTSEEEGNNVVTSTITSVNVVPTMDKTIDEELMPSNTTTSLVLEKENTDYETLIPVNEVIPDPEVAHVLGNPTKVMIEENEKEDQEINNYQIVQGENEGVPFISEYQPETNIPAQNENLNEPLAENVNYEYPPDNISPEAIFSIEQIENDGILGNFDGIADYSTYTLEEAINHNRMANRNTIRIMDVIDTNMPEARHGLESVSTTLSENPLELTFDTNLDYPDEEYYTSVGDSFQYDTVAEPELIFDTDFGLEESHNIDSVHPTEIVIGLNENYHPEPMPGFVLQPDEVLENPGVDYPVYDEPIIPAAMINIDTPGVEETNFQPEYINSPAPEIHLMVDLPRPVAEFAVDQEPMASMQPMMSSDGSTKETNKLDIPTDTNNIELSMNSDDTALATNFGIIPHENVLVIKFNIGTQEAYVNGRPFSISRPSFLDFIEQIIKMATMSPKMPTQEDYTFDNVDEMYMDMPAQQNQDVFGNDLPYMDYPYREDHDYNPHYYPTYDQDYQPFNPFLDALRRHLMLSRYNRMRSFRNWFDHDSFPQFYHDSYDYNRYW